MLSGNWRPSCLGLNELNCGIMCDRSQRTRRSHSGVPAMTDVNVLLIEFMLIDCGYYTEPVGKI